MMIIYLVLLLLILYFNISAFKIRVIINAAFLFSFIYILSSESLYAMGFFTLFESLSRGDIYELISLNNRIFIWLSVIEFIWTESSLYHIIFGYGFYGQEISGVINEYIVFFTNSFNNITTISTHNSLLQAWINYGLIGVSFYFFIINKLITMVSLKGDRIFLFVLLIIVLPSSLEAYMVVPTILSMLFYILVFIIFTTSKKL